MRYTQTRSETFYTEIFLVDATQLSVYTCSYSVMWQVLQVLAAQIGDERIAPHTLRRRTGRYLRCTQRIAIAVNDKIGIEPGNAASPPLEWLPTIGEFAGAIRKTCGCERSSLLASAVARGARQPL